MHDFSRPLFQPKYLKILAKTLAVKKMGRPRLMNAVFSIESGSSCIKRDVRNVADGTSTSRSMHQWLLEF